MASLLGSADTGGAGTGSDASQPGGAPAANRAAASTQGSPAAASGEPQLIRLLLVDDHEDTNRSLMLLLGRRGYKVRAATSVQTALEMAANEEHDVLVSDMSLPDGNGLDLLAQLGPHAPVYGGIVLSGYNDDTDLERSRQAGYKAHLAKPVELPKLDATIRRIIAEATGQTRA